MYLVPKDCGYRVQLIKHRIPKKCKLIILCGNFITILWMAMAMCWALLKSLQKSESTEPCLHLWRFYSEMNKKKKKYHRGYTASYLYVYGCVLNTSTSFSVRIFCWKKKFTPITCRSQWELVNSFYSRGFSRRKSNSIISTCMIGKWMCKETGESWWITIWLSDW